MLESVMFTRISLTPILTRPRHEVDNWPEPSDWNIVHLQEKRDVEVILTLPQDQTYCQASFDVIQVSTVKKASNRLAF